MPHSEFIKYIEHVLPSIVVKIINVSTKRIHALQSTKIIMITMCSYILLQVI